MSRRKIQPPKPTPLHAVKSAPPQELDAWGHHADWRAWSEPDPGHTEKIRKWASGES